MQLKALVIAKEWGERHDIYAPKSRTLRSHSEAILLADAGRVIQSSLD